MKNNRQKLKRIVTGFLLSIILFITTACDRQEVSTRQVDLSTGKQEAGADIFKIAESRVIRQR